MRSRIRSSLGARYAAFSVALLLAASLPGFGQTDRGRLTGTILDPANAVVPNAKIEARNVDTGAVFEGGASATGNYVIPVPTGKYELSVTAQGFKKFVRQNLEVRVASETRLDVNLEVGAQAETITVNEAAPVLRTESGEVSHTVTTDEANNLPVLTTAGGNFFGATRMGNIRNPLAESLLLPGVAFSNDQSLVVNGLPSNSETIRIEGQESSGTIWKVGQQTSQGSVDAIQEVAIQTSNFAAEYGQAAGGYFNYTMKSGTNQFHGSAYDYFVNEALNAGLPWTDAATQSPDKAGQHIRNAVRRHDYGFTFGGPISIPKLYNGRDRSFFFFNFEQFRENQVISNGVTTLPTTAYRAGDFNLAGCFAYVPAANFCAFAPGVQGTDSAGQSVAWGQIFDPHTTRSVNGFLVRTPYANNQIPLSQLDPTALKIQNLMPLPNNPNLTNNYNIPAYTNFQHTTIPSFKLDHVVSPTIKISGYYSNTRTNNPNNNGFAADFSGQSPTANRNHTVRLNYDQSIRPTLLLHFGAGFFHTYQPVIPVRYDQTPLFNATAGKFYDTNLFPTIGGLTNFISGGYGAPGLGGGFKAEIWEQKPTFNTNLTWVKNNHTFKGGAEYTGEGYPEYSSWRSNGNYNFSNAQTADPWQFGQPLAFNNPSGFPYASYLLGLPDQLSVSRLTQTRLGNHMAGLYIQDNWKVTRKLTIDYGLRYDFQTYLKEQYGRMQNASFTTPNLSAGGRPGAIIYEGDGPGRCNCQFSHNYKYALGPRIGGAYQINSKTVLRGGAGIQYGVVQTPAGVSYSTADYYVFNSSAYGISPLTNTGGLAGGNPYAPGNPFGNPDLVWPNFDNSKYPIQNGGLRPPLSPFIFFDPQSRPGRIFTWSIGLQREVMPNLVVEANYVGNRGAWFAAPLLDQMASNSLTPASLKAVGLDISNPTDRLLLTTPIGSPDVIARFPNLANPSAVYPGFPTTQTLGQALRPVPQWNNLTPWLGPPKGNTWYDSLQAKVTKRLSHGLSMQGSFTWAKGLVNGTSVDTTYFLPNIPLINDVYNLPQNKQLNQYVRPIGIVISGTYSTPRLPGSSKAMRAASAVLRDWAVGALLRYQSGALIQSPPSNNQLMTQLQRQALGFGSVQTFWNRVPGQSLLAVDPNCHCFNPQTTQALNPNAWVDAPGGTFGASAPFYNDYRWQRQPAESMSFGRIFHFRKEGKEQLYVRAEFQNIFNRVFLSQPGVGISFFGATNPATPLSQTGNVNSGGYGSIATIGGAGATPRSGQIVARFTF